ncbi:hypothetical protein ACKXGF_02855 [Alkalibacillus sp. S2W]|uniref:hypothetical protein n=1 Tax=Alkalibacillus sp. S2W TaxID=3386553 RepID=UPI00398D02B4
MSYLKPLATEVVAKQIIKWDPMKLLEIGAPLDEYRKEIEMIVEKTLKSRDELELAESIVSIFKLTGNEDLNFDKTLVIAQNIWKEIYE